MTGMAEINPITSVQDYSQTQSVALKNVLKKAEIVNKLSSRVNIKVLNFFRI
jgi:hypothetical protein